ncbi:MAG: stage II sporulation protein P [Peptococcaceae bacterium]|nr:stage II sporulation protein P [Peptococcaceae bacterium]
MNKRRLKIYLAAGLLLAAMMYISALEYKNWLPAWKPLNLMKFAEQADHQAGYLVNIMDNKGEIIAKVARSVSVGDEVIFADGKHYRVTKVGGNYARAQFVDMDKQLLAYMDYFSKLAIPAAAMARNGNNLIGVYHTHSDESYVPTDGSEAIPFKGGIYQVGQSLVDRLKNERVRVAYDRSPHDPHDNNAYYRSRRTATQLMKNNPVALLDVHRDGIPDAQYYSRNISDTDVAQLRLVIGRQNPNMNANLDFARKMMAYANKIHPTIVKEIFIGNGTYNQDLLPTALLIEAGTHTNSRHEAENGVALFADAIPTVLGITGAPGGPGGIGAPRAGGAWKALAWIIGITIVGGGAFLLFSSGGLDKAKSRLSSYIGREFTGFMGPLKGLRLRKITRRANDNIRGPEMPETEYSPDANEIDRENRNKIR